MEIEIILLDTDQIDCTNVAFFYQDQHYQLKEIENIIEILNIQIIEFSDRDLKENQHGSLQSNW
jgi:hypothetical protein